MYVAPTELGVQLTLFQPGVADYAHLIDYCLPYLKTYLHLWSVNKKDIAKNY